MAKAGRIYHWKHGWIPLDAFARAQVADHRRKLDLTVDEKRAELNKRRAARGEAPVKPRTRKPANLADIAARDNGLLTKNYSDMTPAEKIRVAEIMFGKDSSQANAARKKFAPVEGPFAVEKTANGIYHVKDKNGKVTLTTTDPVRAQVWLTNQGGMDAKDAKADVRTAKSTAEMRAERYRKVETVDGVDFVTYKSSSMDPLGSDHGNPYQLTHDQMVPIADAYNEVKAEFPGMKPIQVVGVDGKTGAFGITSWDGRRISISKDTFDEAKINFAAKQWGDHGAIAGQFVDDPEGFARAVMTHELGHALQMQNAEAMRKGQQLALERVTPAEVGVDTTGWSPDAAKEKAMRWEVDTLGKQSVYATGNKFEWFAEAFADGWFNGDKATPQGKLALGILRDAYGKAAA